MATLDLHSPVAWLRLGIGLVWIVFGLLFKALGAVPRHRRIVARVLGERASGPVLFAVAAGETALGLWMIYGRFLPACVALQTLAIVSMNALELRYARDLLVSPAGMVCANVALLALGWYVALA
jgi:DoxX-like family